MPREILDRFNDTFRRITPKRLTDDIRGTSTLRCVWHTRKGTLCRMEICFIAIAL